MRRCWATSGTGKTGVPRRGKIMREGMWGAFSPSPRLAGKVESESESEVVVEVVEEELEEVEEVAVEEESLRTSVLSTSMTLSS